MFLQAFLSMFTCQIYTKRILQIWRSISRSIEKTSKFMVSFYETPTNMSISEILLTNIDEKINIIVEKDHQFLFNSIAWGYHARVDVWTPIVGDEICI